MSSPRYRWWGYVRNVIRAYPDLHTQLMDLRAMKMVPEYTGMPSGGGTGDPVMNAAIRALPDRQEQREHDAVERAIELTELLQNGEQRMRIIRMVYWEDRCTVEMAGQTVGYGSTQARKLHGEFVYLVAKNLGLIERAAPRAKKM